MVKDSTVRKDPSVKKRSIQSLADPTVATENAYLLLFIPRAGVMKIPGTSQAVILNSLVVHVMARGMKITGLTTKAAVVQAKRLSSSHANARMEMDGMEATFMSRRFQWTLRFV
mmetsp:Transcript_38585/g.72316  ORF Transcript_38585/g.72316 Transcript_38585/m.72316 type:complete len:114 (+) Transcript_38585:175-516(+)